MGGASLQKVSSSMGYTLSYFKNTVPMGDAMDWYEGNNGLDQDNGGHSFIRTQQLALGTDDDLWAKAQIVA